MRWRREAHLIEQYGLLPLLRRKGSSSQTCNHHWIWHHECPVSLLEENARANPDARIRPLTHVSVDQAYQAESVGRNSLVTILLLLFVALQIYEWKSSGEIVSFEISWKICFKKRISS